MVANDNFLLTVTKGSILHRADGTFIRLDSIPENAFDMWKEGSRVFALRESGAELLKDLTTAELEQIYSKRFPNNINVELQVILKAIKAKSVSDKPKKKTNSQEVE